MVMMTLVMMTMLMMTTMMMTTMVTMTIVTIEHLSQDFVNVLSYFRPVSKKTWKNLKNTKKDKLMFSFRMYDLDGDGSISVVGH